MPLKLIAKSAKTLNEVMALSSLYPEYSETGYIGSPQYEYDQIKAGNRELLYLGSQSVPVGTIQILYKDTNADDPRLMAPRCAHIQRLRIAPDHQRQGYGRFLCLAAEQAALKHGFSKITLTLDRDNHPARRLYAGLGYHLLDEITGKSGHPLFAMQKEL